MHSTSPTRFRERGTVFAMPWDGTLVSATYVIKWLQSREGVFAKHIENRFGDECIEINQPNLDTMYLRPDWHVVDDGSEFWVMNPFQFRADYGPDDRAAEEALDRVRMVRDKIALTLEEKGERTPGPILKIYETFVKLIDGAIKGEGE